MNAPNTLDDSCGAAERYASAEFQGRETGNVDLSARTKRYCWHSCVSWCLMLPFNQEDVLDYDVCEDDLNRKIADYSGTGDAAQVLKDITDVGRYVEVNGRLCQRRW